jgi:hypothetical protein
MSIKNQEPRYFYLNFNNYCNHDGFRAWGDSNPPKGMLTSVQIWESPCLVSEAKANHVEMQMTAHPFLFKSASFVKSFLNSITVSSGVMERIC